MIRNHIMTSCHHFMTSRDHDQINASFCRYPATGRLGKCFNDRLI